MRKRWETISDFNDWQAIVRGPNEYDEYVVSVYTPLLPSGSRMEYEPARAYCCDLVDACYTAVEAAFGQEAMRAASIE